MRLLLRLPTGERHDLSSLSDGEQRVLALMYFASRTSATGGILLIDEPELHLHPSLQQALIDVLRSMSDRAQVWIATHAAKLIAASPLGGLVHLQPPRRRLYQLTPNGAAAARNLLADRRPGALRRLAQRPRPGPALFGWLRGLTGGAR